MLQETISKNNTVIENLWLFFMWKLQNFLIVPHKQTFWLVMGPKVHWVQTKRGLALQ